MFTPCLMPVFGCSSVGFSLILFLSLGYVGLVSVFPSPHVLLISEVKKNVNSSCVLNWCLAEGSCLGWDSCRFVCVFFSCQWPFTWRWQYNLSRSWVCTPLCSVMYSKKKCSRKKHKCLKNPCLLVFVICVLFYFCYYNIGFISSKQFSHYSLQCKRINKNQVDLSKGSTN